jgi:hypothetical protein
MIEVQRVVLLVAVAGVLFLTAGVGTVAADAPDCSAVSYNGDGTEANPYEVGDVDQLQCINERGFDAAYEVISDIDASETSSWNSGKGFDPIGEFDETSESVIIFNGTFNGVDHNITDLTINRDDKNGVGLFGILGGSGTVTNVEIADADINGHSGVGSLIGLNRGGTINKAQARGIVNGSDFGVGGLIGLNRGGTINKAQARGIVNGTSEVGGLVGSNSRRGTINEGHATAEVNGVSSDVGGLVGRNFGGTIDESYATGEVEGSFFVGGFIGDTDRGSKISESHATGKVDGGLIVGGFAGNINGNVEDSYAAADVNGSELVGGFVGDNFNGTMESTYATGEVDGSEGVGGLAGRNGGTIKESYATGSANGSVVVGGFAGDNAGTISESYAVGSANGSRGVGGFVGDNLQGTINRSYTTAEVDGSRFAGGLVGSNAGGNISESYATGEVEGDSEVGGLVGRNEFRKYEANVTDSYWDTESTGQPDSDGGTGLTTSEMTGSAATSNMDGFDFTSTWETVTTPDDYPILAFQTEDDPEPANFEVSIDSTNSPVTEGETLTVTGTITNTGGQQDTQTITASAPGLGPITRPVTLDAGESRTETVSIPTSTGDAGSFSITVETADDTATTTVTINPDGGGGLSPNNPFGDSNNNPVDRSTVINRVVEWNLNGEIGGTSYTRQEIIDFVVEWNLA